MKKKFVCIICGYVHEGTEPPENCPVCKKPTEYFKEMDDISDQD